MYPAVLLVLFLLRSIGAQEQCVTPSNQSGTCINIRSCPSLVEILRKRPLTQESLDFLKNSQCGFEGRDPMVCCPQQSSMTTRPSVPTEGPNTPTAIADPPDVTNHPNLRLLNHDICGPITQGKIFGGNKTGINEFPWMALIAYDTGRQIPEFRCGGTVINKRYVLTAAHCVTSLPLAFKVIGVRLGEHDVSTERDCEKDDNELELCAERYQDFGIANIAFHPGYTRTKLHNDIALIRLNNDADFRPRNVRPICLPIGRSSALTKNKMIVTGWGATELGPQSQDLLKVQLTIVDTEECKRAYQSKADIWYKQICAGGKKNMDSCVGDSGGPLQVPGTYNNNLRFIQYGIVSFGLKSCGTEGVPGVYTRLVYYMDWVLDNISE